MDVSGELARRINRRQFLFGGRNSGGGGSETGGLGTILGAAGVGVGVLALGSPASSAINHALLGNVLPDQHHARSHAMSGDHSDFDFQLNPFINAVLEYD